MSDSPKKSARHAEVRSPIAFVPCSNGEFSPRAPTAHDRLAHERFLALVEDPPPVPCRLAAKFILGEPVVACPIPATSNPDHLADNVRAGFGRMPDAALRRKMIAAIG